MNNLAKIKKLVNLAKQVFQGNDLGIYILYQDYDTKKYEYTNKLNEKEIFESAEDFRKKKNIPDDKMIVCIKYA